VGNKEGRFFISTTKRFCSVVSSNSISSKLADLLHQFSPVLLFHRMTCPARLEAERLLPTG
jgi:hypothetical protein